MNLNDRHACFIAFSNLCEEVGQSDLLNSEDCQYWVYERGYRAAIQDLLNIIQSRALGQKLASPELQSIAHHLVFH